MYSIYQKFRITCLSLIISFEILLLLTDVNYDQYPYLGIFHVVNLMLTIMLLHLALNDVPLWIIYAVINILFMIEIYGILIELMQKVPSFNEISHMDNVYKLHTQLMFVSYIILMILNSVIMVGMICTYSIIISQSDDISYDNDNNA